MKWNWHIGKIFGIDLKVHTTFLFLLGWIALADLVKDGPLGSLIGVVLCLLVFGVVVLHELGHALAARAVGIPTRDITLWPIGGVARLERMPRNPLHEIYVSAAGPAVNLVLAGLGALVFYLLPVAGVGAVLLQWFIGVNVALLVFNLIPAFPMDGGRILRAVLTRRHGLVVATEKAARVARWTALAFGLFGLVTLRFTLVLIALFVWFSSTSEVNILRAQAQPGVFFIDPKTDVISAPGRNVFVRYVKY